MMTPPPWDPRQAFSVSRWSPGGLWVTVEPSARSLADGVERIEGGFLYDAGGALAALNECGSCGFIECNLVEGWAARVRRLGPYVLWISPSGRSAVFDLPRYRELLGGDVEALPVLSPDDACDLDDVATAGAYVLDGRHHVFGGKNEEDTPLDALRGWPAYGAGELVAVTPPGGAIEVRSTIPERPSLWIHTGRRAGFFPGLVRAPVWVAGPPVDRVLGALVG